ncbi:MAG: hypothetical protein R3182_00780, partial [Draconibacterium sp.]|nr:hypothetical protein [Draconibacterium sp.]
MNKFTQIFLIVLCSVFITSQLFSQDKMVHGIVTTFDSIPLVGAEVKAVGTKLTIKTDNSGKYIIGCNTKDKLKISAKGFFPETVKLSENTKVVATNLRLKPGDKAKKYAIGYGHVTDKEKLFSLAAIDESDKDFSMYDNMFDLLRGEVPGVQVTKGNTIIIRGVGSFNLSNSALIVVDGIPYPN